MKKYIVHTEFKDLHEKVLLPGDKLLVPKFDDYWKDVERFDGTIFHISAFDVFNFCNLLEDEKDQKCESSQPPLVISPAIKAWLKTISNYNADK